MQLKVMTFNVRGSFDDGRNAWPHRAPLNVQLIKQYSPDLLGLQEAHAANLLTYETELGEYEQFAGYPADKLELYAYNAIFWRRERFEQLDAGGFYISLTPEEWSSDWGSVCVRVVNWALLRDRTSHHALLHLNTHLDHFSEAARLAGCRLLIERSQALAGSQIPIVVTGDFNCNPWSPEVNGRLPAPAAPYQLLREHGFVDLYLAAGANDGLAAHTFHGFNGRDYAPFAPEMPLRIDWILAHPGRRYRLEVTSCQIVHDAQPPLYPSDHYPVLADLALYPEADND